MPARLHAVHARVQTENGLHGTVKGHTILAGIHGRPHDAIGLFYIIELDTLDQFYAEGQQTYVSLLCTHADTVRTETPRAATLPVADAVALATGDPILRERDARGGYIVPRVVGR